MTRRPALRLVALACAALAAASPSRAQDRPARDSARVVDSLARARDSSTSHRVEQTSPSASPAPASTDPELEARTRALAAELRCPVCQGVSIQDSPSELAQEMKAVVREQLAQGRTPEEVRRYFVSRYGEWILLRPEARGFNLAVYVLPLAALLGGAAVVALVVRRWTRGRSLFADEATAYAGKADPSRE